MCALATSRHHQHSVHSALSRVCEDVFGGDVGGDVAFSPTCLLEVFALLARGTGKSISLLQLAHAGGGGGVDVLFENVGKVRESFDKVGGLYSGTAVISDRGVSSVYRSSVLGEGGGGGVEFFENSGELQRELNEWVLGVTKGMISSLRVRVSGGGVILANAFSFDAKWVDKFTLAPRDQPFVVDGRVGGSKMTRFMRGERLRVPLVQLGTSTTVALPMKNGCYALFCRAVGTGDAPVALRDLLFVLESPVRAASLAVDTLVSLRVPVFRVEASTDLLGAFGDLSGMVLERLDVGGGVQQGDSPRVGQVLQKIVVDVGVDGVKAAGASAAVLGRGISLGATSTPLSVTLNRPFAYAFLTGAHIPFIVGTFSGRLL